MQGYNNARTSFSRTEEQQISRRAVPRKTTAEATIQCKGTERCHIVASIDSAERLRAEPDNKTDQVGMETSTESTAESFRLIRTTRDSRRRGRKVRRRRK